MIQGFKMNKKFVDAIIISEAPKQILDGSLLPAQHYISFYYHNRRPNLLFCPLEQPDIYAEPLINHIKNWRAKIINKDFEAYLKNMGYLIAVDSFHKIFCNKRIDFLLTKSATEEIQLLMETRTDYILS